MAKPELPTIISKVALRVRDIERLTKFYDEIIGLTVRQRSSDVVELGTETRTLIALHHTPNGTRPAHAPGLYHLALRVPTRADLGQWLRHYIEVGNPLWQGASDHLVSEALYLSDPEGNGIEVYWDKPATAWPRVDGGRVRMAVDPLDLGDVIADANPAAWQGLPDFTDMGHVHLQVSDMQQTHDFYTNHLDLNVMTSFGDSALFVSTGGYHHHFGLNTWHSLGAAPRTEDALGLESVEVSVDAEQLAQFADIEGLEQTSATSLSLRDPSGNRLVLQEQP